MGKKGKRKMTDIGGLTTTTVVGGKYKCHDGNVSVMHVKGGGALFCGGWSRLADGEGMAVIDLTGSEKVDGGSPIVPKNEEAKKMFKSTIASTSSRRTQPWLSFHIKDFGIPTVERATWIALSEDVYALMAQGVNVLVACTGGHGRTGMTASILCYLMNNTIGDPVTYLRGVYCNHAVETRAQHEYVHEMLELPAPAQLEYKHEYKTGTNVLGGQYWGGYGAGWNMANNYTSPYKQPDGGEKDKKPVDKGGMIPVHAMSHMEREHLISVFKTNDVDFTEFTDVRGRYFQVAILIDRSVEFFEVTDFDRVDEKVLMAPIDEPGKEVIATIKELAKVKEMDMFYSQASSGPKG